MWVVAFNPLLRKSHTRLLIVNNDCIMCNQRLRKIANVVCRGRHANISVAYSNPSIFHANPFHSTITLNSINFRILRLQDVNQRRFFGETFLRKKEQILFVLVYKTNIELVNNGHFREDFSPTSHSKLLIQSTIAVPVLWTGCCPITPFVLHIFSLVIKSYYDGDNLLWSRESRFIFSFAALQREYKNGKPRPQNKMLRLFTGVWVYTKYKHAPVRFSRRVFTASRPGL